MHRSKYLLLIIFIINIQVINYAQSKKTIDSMETKYQSCLDQGNNMLKRSKNFYFEMDSLLTVVYTKLYNQLNSDNKLKLEIEQYKWNHKKDIYFKNSLLKFQTNNPNSSPYGAALGSQDAAMFMYNKNAMFIKKRIASLLKKEL